MARRPGLLPEDNGEDGGLIASEDDAPRLRFPSWFKSPPPFWPPAAPSRPPPSPRPRPHPTYPGPCPRLRLRPRPRPLVASISVHSLREGCRSSVARGRLGVASCVPCFRQPRRKRGRPRSRLAALGSVFCLQAAAFAVLNKLWFRAFQALHAASFRGRIQP